MKASQVIGRPNLTEWTNPTKHLIKLEIFTGEGRDPFIRIEIPPGETTLLPSQFDNTIQSVDASGVIQSGLAPQLIKNGERRPMHAALDPALTAVREAEDKAAEAARIRAEADAATMRANAERDRSLAEIKRQEAEAEAEAAKRAADDAAAKGKAEAEAKAKAKAERDAAKAGQSGGGGGS
jgi:hypothetical protein